MTTFWKCHGHVASIGSCLEKLWALYQSICALEDVRPSLVNPKRVNFKSTISPLLKLQLGRFFTNLSNLSKGTQNCN